MQYYLEPREQIEQNKLDIEGFLKKLEQTRSKTKEHFFLYKSVEAILPQHQTASPVVESKASHAKVQQKIASSKQYFKNNSAIIQSKKKPHILDKDRELDSNKHLANIMQAYQTIAVKMPTGNSGNGGGENIKNDKKINSIIKINQGSQNKSICKYENEMNRHI